MEPSLVFLSRIVGLSLRLGHSLEIVPNGNYYYFNVGKYKFGAYLPLTLETLAECYSYLDTQIKIDEGYFDGLLEERKLKLESEKLNTSNKSEGAYLTQLYYQEANKKICELGACPHPEHQKD